MKILQIAPRLPYPLTDGGATGIFKATEATARSGADITLVTYPDSDPAITRTGLKKISEFAKVHLVSKPLPSRYLTLAKTIFKGAYPVERRMMPEMFELLGSIVEREHFDLVHVDHAHMGKYALWLKERYGLPYVLREHNFECLIYERFASVQRDPLKKAVAAIHGKRLRKEETKFIREAAHVAPITEQDLALMRQALPEQRYTVIPAGVDVDYFRPTESSLIDPKLILWVGGMSWDPNKEAIDYFLREIWPGLKLRDAKVRFELVGDGTERLALSAHEGVKGHGRVPDIRPFLARAAVLVVPLRVGGGMRLKILDFLAAGKAVVSTSIGAEGNRARSGQDLLIADTPDEFGAAIQRVVSDPLLREKLGASGRHLVESEYAWEKIGQAFMRVYGLVSERKTAPISADVEL